MTGSFQNFTDAIGNTPLIRLRRASQETGCEIYGKAEFLNPGGSIKDRAAKQIIFDAEKNNEIEPGGLIIEGTGGNTGIGLALVANSQGYRTLITIPDNQSSEKKEMLRLCGAQLIETPPVPYSNPENYVRTAERLATKLKKTENRGVLYANQWDNPANPAAHTSTTGPEIWAQTQGSVDAFICSIGTGGTIGGVSTALRERNPDVKIGLADPEGSAMASYFEEGRLASNGSSITEGIGQGRLIDNVKSLQIDQIYRISDSEALLVLFDLLEHEGLCLGGSSGINVAGAVKMAKALGPGHTVITVLCDHGQRYKSKLYSPAFLKEKGLPSPPWL